MSSGKAVRLSRTPLPPNSALLLPPRLTTRIDWPEAGDGCWIWHGARTKAGYGQSWLDGRPQVAHRVVYKLLVNADLSDALELNHLCRVTSCVNPAHLEPLTPTAHRNLSRHTHCKYGHSMADAFERFYRGQIHRRCRPCTLESNRRSSRKTKEHSNA